MNTILLRLLNIKSSEAWLVRNLFLMQLFQSIGIAMLLPLANALFLAQFNVEELPKVYMLSAIVLILVNYIYSKLEHHIPIQKLILYILFFAALSIFIIRWMIYSVQYEYAPVVALIWYQVIYMLCGSSFWGLASLVFDLRESKRTFGILSAGDTPAKLLGYLSVSGFAASVGIKNFLFISVVCFFISFLFMRTIIRSGKIDFDELAHKASHKEPLRALPSPGPLEMIKSFFGNNLILLISILSFIVIASLTVIDFTFLSEVSMKYHNDVALATFLGYFFALSRGFAILAKITLTSRIERQLGIKRSLLLLPLLLIAFTIFILLSEQFSKTLSFYLYIFASMVVITEVLKSVLQEPLVLVLFQPLKPVMRLKGHLIAKGIMAPLGLFFAGLFIYINVQMIGGMHIAKTCLLLLMLCSIWLIIVHLIDRQYVTSLLESLRTGFFRGNFILNNDDAVKSILKEKMKSSKNLEVIYAADMLEHSDPPAFEEEVLGLLDHPHPDIRKFALKKITERKLSKAVFRIKTLVDAPLQDDIKIECLSTLSHLEEDRSDALVSYLDHSSPEIQKQAMLALFTTGDISSVIVAGKRLIEWMNSNSSLQRMQAAEAIGSIADKNFYASLATLMNDPSPEVEIKAIEAAGKIKNARLIPLLIEKLQTSGTARYARRALSECGEEVLEHPLLANNVQEVDRKTLLHYIHIATNIRGEKAKAFLEKILKTRKHLKHEAIGALYDLNYSVASHMKSHMLELIQREVDITREQIDYLNVFSVSDDTKILANALLTELQTSETSIFYLFSFLYDRQKFQEAYRNIQSGQKENIANAIEIVDLGVSKKICSKFIPVIEYLHLNDRSSHPKPSRDEKFQYMRTIAGDTSNTFNSWTRAIAIYLMNITDYEETLLFLQNFSPDREFILEETMDFVLSKQVKYAAD